MIFNVRPCFLKPVRHQISPTRNAACKYLSQRFGVVIAQFGAHFLVPQKRWIPHHHAGLGPLGFNRRSPASVKRQQRIAALDMVERLQHRVGLELVAVQQPPLKLANPHRHARQFGGVFVQLDAEHVVRAGHQIRFALQPQRGRFNVALVLDVLQRLQAHEQKIAAAAGRVKHAKVFQLVKPANELHLRGPVVFIAFLGAFGQQRLQHGHQLLPNL